MIDDFENEIREEIQEESTSDKFKIKEFYHPGLKQDENILCMSTSKKYIYLVSKGSELLLIDSTSLRPIKEKYRIPSAETNKTFNENITKIWSDRCGNHNIFRYRHAIYYFNPNFPEVKELKNFTNKEICAVSFDDRNNDTKSTNNFLVSDYYNNFYECNIVIENNEGSKEFTIKDNIEKLTQLLDIENEEEDEFNEQYKKISERIYGIKFVRAIKDKNKDNEDACFIVAVTKNRFYQFVGPDISSFKRLFQRYNLNPSLFNSSCKYFPSNYNINDSKLTDINILYKKKEKSSDNGNSSDNELLNQFGWKTDSGYCFGQFNYDRKGSYAIPYEQKNFTVIPFSRITSQGEKGHKQEPIDITHTHNHIFILYKDCLTVISKLTSYIIHTLYFRTSYDHIIYNEFSKDNEILLLTSANGLYQISLKDENIDIWKDYLEVGDFDKAKVFCGSQKMVKRINRIIAEKFFEEKNGFSAITNFALSDESFENVCLKYLMNDSYEELKIYLEYYKDSNLYEEKEKEKEKGKEKEKEKEKGKKENKDENNKKEDKDQLFLICTWVIEIFLRDSKSSLNNFRLMIRDYSKHLNKELIYQLLLSYGRIEEFIEFASLMGDYQRVILFFINQGDIEKALEKINWFITCTDDQETLEKLTDIFSEYINFFLKANPKESINLLQQKFKNIKTENLIQAIFNSILKDYSNDQINDNSNKKINNQAIIEYLKTLIDKPKIEEDKNIQMIHNIYLYFLSKSKGYEESLLDYLKGPFIKPKKTFSIYNKKKEVLCQLDFAKRLLKKNPPAYCLVLALMGNYSQAIKHALNQRKKDYQKIATFIASNAPSESLKKKLWIDIFKNNNQNELKQALNIIKESKILKIEDILPYMNDTIKIEDFQKQIGDCIDEYELNIKKIKENISDYNIAAENVKNDINKIKKRPMEIKKSDCKCEICKKQIISNYNIFIFPCGHIFDMNCIKEYLLDYEVTGLHYLHDKNVEIDNLFFELGFSKQKVFNYPNNDKIQISKTTKQDNALEKGGTFFKIKKIESTEVKFERKKNLRDIGKTKNRLFDLLSEQCVLCGDFIIDSIQFSLSQKDVFKPDKNGLQLKIQREKDFLY